MFPEESLNDMNQNCKASIAIGEATLPKKVPTVSTACSSPDPEIEQEVCEDDSLELKDFEDTYDENMARNNERKLRIQQLTQLAEENDQETERQIMYENNQKRLQKCMFRSLTHKTLAKSKKAQFEYMQRFKSEQFHSIVNKYFSNAKKD